MADVQLTVKVPKGLSGGDNVQITHAGQLFNVTVPPGLQGGDEFVANVPAGGGVPSGTPVAQGVVVNGGAAEPPPPAYAVGEAAAQPASSVVYGQPAPDAQPAVCRGCGRTFHRLPGTRPQTAQWYRCQDCQGATIPCAVM
mmetsp:Transcript_13470/g.39752  ORF Transcript_13470/g.39752 Transcript_13470/m.39752 type:complete len:141 (-) Transcript_13470:320-742(-)